MVYVLEDAIADARIIKKYLKKLTSKRSRGLAATIMNLLRKEIPEFSPDKQLIIISNIFNELVESLEKRIMADDKPDNVQWDDGTKGDSY